MLAILKKITCDCRRRRMIKKLGVWILALDVRATETVHVFLWKANIIYLKQQKWWWFHIEKILLWMSDFLITSPSLLMSSESLQRPEWIKQQQPLEQIWWCPRMNYLRWLTFVGGKAAITNMNMIKKKILIDLNGVADNWSPSWHLDDKGRIKSDCQSTCVEDCKDICRWEITHILYLGRYCSHLIPR